MQPSAPPLPAGGGACPASGAGSLRLLIDGECPFCSTEGRWLQRHDHHGRLTLVDINDPSFQPEACGLRRSEVEDGLHAILPDGRVVTRMDAVRAAYEAVGRGWITAPTRWPGLRWLFDRAYDLFARNRVRWGNAVLRLSRRHRATPRTGR